MSPNPVAVAADPKVIVALDFADAAAALALVDRLDPDACALKVGNEMFVSAGPEPVEALVARGLCHLDHTGKITSDLALEWGRPSPGQPRPGRHRADPRSRPGPRQRALTSGAP